MDDLKETSELIFHILWRIFQKKICIMFSLICWWRPCRLCGQLEKYIFKRILETLAAQKLRNEFKHSKKVFICFLPKFPETECSDEIFDYTEPFILVAFPPLTLDHLLKTARKETNKHSSFVMSMVIGRFINRVFSIQKEPCNFSKAPSGYYPGKYKTAASKYLLILLILQLSRSGSSNSGVRILQLTRDRGMLVPTL